MDLDTVRVQVLLDPPVADAGTDTTVSLSDTVWLRGRGEDKFGSIVSWEWDIGRSGSFKRVSGRDTFALAPPTSANVGHVLRVRDDDGNVSLDTLRVFVRDDRPTVSLTLYPRLIDNGGGYWLHAEGKDLGRITRWEWDFGDGEFRQGYGPDTVFRPAEPPGTSVTARVKVFDEDGNSAVASGSLIISTWEYAEDFPAALEDMVSVQRDRGGRENIRLGTAG